MKWQECYKVACWNMVSFKKNSVKVLIGLTTVVVLLFGLLSYKSVFEEQKGTIEEKYQNNCYLEKYVGYSEWDSYEREITELLEQKTLIGYEESNALITMMFKEEVDYDMHKIKLVMNNKTYKKKYDVLEGIGAPKKAYETEDLQLFLWDNRLPPFPSKIVKDSEGKVFMGDTPRQEGELMVSDYLLEELGVKREEQRNCVGKKVSLYLQDEKYVAFEDYIIKGIYSIDLLERRERNNQGFPSYEHIYIYPTKADKEKYKEIHGMVRLYVNDYTKLMKCYEKAIEWDKNVELSISGAVYEVLAKHIATINDVLTYVIAGFLFAVSIYLLCVLYFFFKQNEKYVRMLRIIGMQRKDMYTIIFFEVLNFSLISLILGVYVGTFILYAFKYIYEYALTMKFVYPYQLLVRSAIISFVYCFGMCFLFGLLFLKSKRKGLLV